MNRISRSKTRHHPPNRLIAVAASAAFGFMIWAVSPTLTGFHEPWDSELPFYSATSLVGGSILGFFLHRHPMFLYLGAWWGQVVALAVLPGLDRGWLLLGVITTAVGSTLTLLGGMIGRVVRLMGRQRLVER